MRFHILLCLLVPLLGPSPLGLEALGRMQGTSVQIPAKQFPPQPSQPIRVSTNLIQVPVSVTDAAGNAVKTLQKEDFLIEENGIPVAIAHLGEPGETRLEMVLVFDISGSVYARFDFEKEAAASFLQKVFRLRDEVSILSISSAPRIVLNRATAMGVALEGLSLLKPSAADTAFYDSVIAAARMFQDPADLETRRVQIVLSDGEDNRSELQLADALREMQRADCIFYSINPGGQSIRLNKLSLRGQQGMETLAAQTGGAAFLADKLQDLIGIYGRIAAELQAQYLLSYYAPDQKADGSFRRVAVRVPKQPELRIRARQGYYARKAAAKEGTLPN
jgi:Ca-activated chloride channel family protein